jgi:quercetin dioxygenase-like cupin family protein
LLFPNAEVRLWKKGGKMKHTHIDDHRDPRGFVVNPFEHLEDTGEVTNFHVFSIEPGHARGDHRHPARNEQVLVVAGSITVKTDAGSTVLRREPSAMLTIPMGMNHTFVNEGTETAVVMCWSTEREEGHNGEDTVRG